MSMTQITPQIYIKFLILSNLFKYFLHPTLQDAGQEQTMSFFCISQQKDLSL
jgi:hypothetical protein